MSDPNPQQRDAIMSLFKQGHLQQSLDEATKLLTYFPNSIFLHQISGGSNFGLKNFDAAILHYKKVLKVKPNNEKIHNNIGIVFQETGDTKSAISSYKKAVRIQPNYAEAYNNMGIAYRQKGNFDLALQSYDKALKINPNFIKALYGSATTLQLRGSLSAAIDCYEKVLELEPNNFNAHMSIAGAQRQGRDFKNALLNIETALQLKPNNAEALLNRSMLFLQSGDFRNGFLDYEYRFNASSYDVMERLVNNNEKLVTRKPEWTPSAHGSRVLLRAEQGIGDEVLFAATILDLYDRSRELTIQIDERLIPLFERSFPNDIKFCSKKEKIPEKKYDFHISMGSTLQYFRKDLESFNKTSDGFLKADAALSSKLRKKLMVGDCDCLVGLSWRGGHDGNRAQKSIELSEIAKTLSSSKIKIINLQYGETDLEIKELADNLGITIHSVSEIDNFKDVDGLSALIDACDHVVSVSTLVVHLAGALGKKTTVLLPFACDWRWGENGTESYWYSSIKLLRQKNISDWTAPIEQLQSIFKEDTDKVLDL